MRIPLRMKPPTPRARTPRRSADGDELISVALALTAGQTQDLDTTARLLGISRRSYARICLETGLAMIAEGEVPVLGESISENAAFISVRVEASVLKPLDAIVVAHKTNRRWVATVALLARRAERLRTGEDPTAERSASRKHADERLAHLERRMVRLERIVEKMAR